jgi:hypothetical protein
MNSIHWRSNPAMRALLSSCMLAFGIAHAADQTTTRPDATVGNKVPQAMPARGAVVRRPLDLRLPALRNVTAHGVLAGLSVEDEDETVEIVAEPALVLMSSDTQAPLGIISSLQWSVNHPTQAFRILLPASFAP